MPSRYIREGILTSEKVDKLSLGAEVLYRRLLSAVDDYGRFHGQLKLIIARCYPLRCGVVTEEEVAQWLEECEAAGLLTRYTACGKPHIEIHNTLWQKRTSSRFPAPPNAPRSTPMRTSARGCEQLRADENASSCAHLRADEPVFGNGNGNGNEYGNVFSVASKEATAPAREDGKDAVEQPGSAMEESVLVFPCRGLAREWVLTRGKLTQLEACYPGINVLAELRKLLARVQMTPNLRHTAQGMGRACTNWLNIAADRARLPTSNGTHQAPRPATVVREDR